MTRFGSPANSWKTLTRAIAAGLVLAAAFAVGGRVLERQRFGATDQESLTRIERELRERFDTGASTLAALTARVAVSSHLIATAAQDKAHAKELFDILDVLRSGPSPVTGITVYDSARLPVAWSGRVSDIDRERIDGPASLFVAPGAFGPFLVRVEPVPDPDHPASRRLGTVVAEQLLGEPTGAPGADQFVFSGSLAPVTLRTAVVSPSRNAYSLVIPSSGGQLLVEGQVDPAGLAAARERWRARTRAAVYAMIALTLLISAAPFTDLWRRARSRRQVFAALAAILIILTGARVLLLAASAAFLASPSRASVQLLLDGLFLTALLGLALDAVERWRIARPRRRLLQPGTGAAWWTALVYPAAGALNIVILWNYERVLQRIVSNPAIDLLRFSLHPLTAERLAISFGLLLLHASVIWSGALVIHVARLLWRTPRSTSRRALASALWLAGVAAGMMLTPRLSPPLNPAAPGIYLPMLVALLATALCAAVLGRPRGPVRKASQAFRLFGLYVALLVPALATYPSILAFAVQAKEELVANTFGPQAKSVREELQRQLNEALAEIDANPALPLLLEGAPGPDSPASDPAYRLWSETTLRKSRLTSAVELYGANGNLVSRFALNLPEYGTAPHAAPVCPDPTRPPWDGFPEASNVLRASRGVCSPSGRLLGAVVVRVMADYRTLPFASSASPYLESVRFDQLTRPEEAPGHDVEFAVYGWSRAPLYMAGTSVWSLPEPVFQRMVSSRAPFWETVNRGSEAFRVYFLNDRYGIYALGYPIITQFGRLMNLAELVVLTAVLYVLLLSVAKIFNALTSSRPATGRALLREVRSSFYFKLFLSFVVVTIIPALILAVATRNRLNRQFEDSLNESAVKTATVAQRLVEDYAAQQGGTRALDGINDEFLMLVERAIAQDVNLFDHRAVLKATSERDLFASHVFPTRMPADVYRSIVLDRLPTFVNVEDVGAFSYLLAAARVRAGDSERVVTIPLTLRQRELDEQRDDLDRRIWAAFVLFVVIGAGLGYWMAERIADPVNRLTRATRRIARGDLDARIAATSSDELGRLVADFNRMAADLKRQRTELERTQRLEAWADMARQVAHEIKNPLTPIQLSAEHALRINFDRGRPLSPVLDECVSAILSQVRLLRQISTEFSSFASSPTARPEVTELAALIQEVVEPYRTGLSGRIAIEILVDSLPPVTIDRTLFARALTNVIENALHAMPGQGRLTISARAPNDASSAAASQPRVVVTVADTGVGMDQEALARIFEPYFSTKASGTGLGLTIAKRNVELLGGTIGVESQRGTGTIVTITLRAGTPSS